MASNATAATTGSRNVALDGIRGLAILFVIFHHTVIFHYIEPVSGFEKLIAAVAHEGWIGVDLFFVLSGFLITRILLREKGSPTYFRDFYARRTLRIFPLYYLFLTVMFVVLPALYPANTALAELPPQQAWYWLYLPNFKVFLAGDWSSGMTEHTWSLAIEEQFYLLWPLLLALLPVGRLKWVCLGVLPLSIVLRAWLVATGHQTAAVFVFTPAHLDGLMMGALLAILDVRGKLGEPWVRPAAWTAIVVGFGIRALATPLGLSYAQAHDTLYISAWVLVFTGLLTLALTARADSRLIRVLGAKPLVFFGVYSYGLYLMHQPIYRFATMWLRSMHIPAWKHWLILTLTAFPASVLTAWLVFNVFESRFLALKRYFHGAPGPIPASVPVSA